MEPDVPILDVNCGCGVWPFRPTPAADAASLERLLRAEGVTRACAYPLEAYLWPDPQEANELRLPQLAESDFFVPSAVLNPTMPACLNTRKSTELKYFVFVMPMTKMKHLLIAGICTGSF